MALELCIHVLAKIKRALLSLIENLFHLHVQNVVPGKLQVKNAI